MTAKQIIDKVKTLLADDKPIPVTLEQAKLADGVTILEADSFAEGVPVFIVTETENIPLPVGNYELEDGRVLVVEVEGTIASVGDAPAEEENAPVEEEAQAVTPVEASVVEETILLSSHDSLIQGYEDKINELESALKLSNEATIAIQLKLDNTPASDKIITAPVDKSVKMSAKQKAKLSKFDKIVLGMNN